MSKTLIFNIWKHIFRILIFFIQTVAINIWTKQKGSQILLNENIGEVIGERLSKLNHPPHIHTLVHPCHWMFTFGFREELLALDQESIDKNMHDAELRNKKAMLKRQKNIRVKDLSGNIFRDYDNAYLNKKNVFPQDPYICFLKKTLRDMENVETMLELGCGQGEFLYEGFSFAERERERERERVVRWEWTPPLWPSPIVQSGTRNVSG